MNSIIFTNKAECRDCNRCVRKCPVKAIRMKDGQASIDESRCIYCGTCVRECPQKAKHFRYDLVIAKNILKQYSKVAVSIAPSYAGVYEKWQWERIASALRKLGFAYIAETAMGAFYTAKATKNVLQNSDKSLIASACPAVVNYIEKYKPESIPNLVEIISPMIAHSKYLKEKLGTEWKIIFIGPCVAKKAEAERKEYEGLIDAVLTFKELNEWFAEEDIKLEEMEESGFNEYSPAIARTFPLMSGLTKTADIEYDIHSCDVISVTGFEEISEAVKLIEKNPSKPILIDPLFCTQGCINGPAIECSLNVFERRHLLLEYAQLDLPKTVPPELKADLSAEFHIKDTVEFPHYSEEEINRVLDKTGNSDPKNRLNCGACGYNSCREKAIAVLNGMAEIEMCLPYVRRMAESQKNKLFETSPNGIVILDYKYNILNMNPAFRKFFICSPSTLGKSISYIMDPEPFIKLMTSEIDKYECTMEHTNYNIITHQIIYKLPEENLIVGIFVNITKNIADKSQLDSLREQTLRQAQELLNHQIDMAQNIAKFLGESAARGESLVDNLMKLSEDKNSKDNNSKNGKQIWDIYTTK